MSKSTISTFQLFQAIPDQESARQYLESRLWPDGVICPTCKKGERITVRKAAEDLMDAIENSKRTINHRTQVTDVYFEMESSLTELKAALEGK